MINRELIRTKVVQLTYAYYQNGNKNIETAEKELIFSLSKAYDLWHRPGPSVRGRNLPLRSSSITGLPSNWRRTRC